MIEATGSVIAESSEEQPVASLIVYHELQDERDIHVDLFGQWRLWVPRPVRFTTRVHLLFRQLFSSFPSHGVPGEWIAYGGNAVISPG